MCTLTCTPFLPFLPVLPVWVQFRWLSCDCSVLYSHNRFFPHCLRFPLCRQTTVLQYRCKRPAKQQLRRLLYDMFARVVCVVCVPDGGWICVFWSVPERRPSLWNTVLFSSRSQISRISFYKHIYPRHHDTVIHSLYGISQGLPLQSLKGYGPRFMFPDFNKEIKI